MVDYTIDLCTGGTPTVSDTQDGTAADVFDDNTGTEWASSNAAMDHWVKYQHIAARRIEKLRIYLDENYGMNSFKIQASANDTNWTDIQTGLNGLVVSPSWKEFTFVNANSYIYWRVFCPAGSSQYGPGLIAIKEIEMMEVIYPKGGILKWFFSQAWEKHDKLWRNNKLILPKDLGYSY
jgi:hypothetical protein